MKVGDKVTIRVKLTRQVIIAAAAEIADLCGLENTTLSAVAKALKVQKPSLYNHIDGLPELRRELAIWGTNQLQAQISEAAIGRSKKEAIIAMASAYRFFAHRRPGLYRAIVASPDRESPSMREAITSMMAVLKAVLRSYHLKEEDTIHACRGLRSLMHGFVTLEAAGWFVSPGDREESYQQLIETFVRGIESACE